MRVRIVEPEDLVEVTIIEKDCFKRPYPTTVFLDFYETNRDGFFVAEEDDELVGYCMAHPNGEVISIAVLPAHRRRGIGSELLRHALSFIKKHGKQASAHVRVGNKFSIAFFEEHGFEKKKLIKRYYPDGEDGWIMIKAF